jgi:hypothetical protein
MFFFHRKLLKLFSHIWSKYRRGFGFDTRISVIDHLYIRLEATSNYSVTANLHNSQITATPAKLFPASCVFRSRSLATASNSGDSSASVAQVRFQLLFSSRNPLQNWLGCPGCVPYNPFARTEYESPFPTVSLWLHAYHLPREGVYRAVA